LAANLLRRRQLPNAESSNYNEQRPQHVGIIGASSLVGASLLPLVIKDGWQVTAFSRQIIQSNSQPVEWRRLPDISQASYRADQQTISHWISLAPLSVLPDYFKLLQTYGARRIVALSSTSRYTKDNSSDLEEQALALRLADAEQAIRNWAENCGMDWVILRPTLIYDVGRDKNITEIIRVIRRFGFFPLFGKASGLRQPIHAQDVAQACFTALQAPAAKNKAYNISGGETLSYRDMVSRIFNALGRKALFLPVPLAAFRIMISILRLLPRYRYWSAAMAERMNQNLVFDHSEARRDLSFTPRAFILSKEDLVQAADKL
jgi:nucleoside-diphosphate-sugar epimerase